MSFRTRLTSFFVLIVIVPMVAIGVLVISPDRRQRTGQGGRTRRRAGGRRGQRL